ncbi:MAG TPA: hypothetical protein VFZ45_00660 [Actinomycetota bacterium]|nr:hypothetical protein [Actinomycetota bacterium]
MKRLFWIGVGVAAAYYGSKWLRRQRERITPENVAARTAERLGGVMELFRVSVEEGRRAAAEKEAEIRSSLGDRHP